MTRALTSIGAMATVVAMGLTGCTASTPDPAGGRGLDKPVVLQIGLASDNPGPTLGLYAAEVEKSSHGSVRLEFTDLGYSDKKDPAYERHLLEDVQSGKVSGTMVGVRSLDLLGLTSLQPLLAPLLVDSQALQKRLYSEGIVRDMTRRLTGNGLVGVTVLPGPMRKVLGISKPFREPSDFRGTTLGIQDGIVARRTAAALGATAKREPAGSDLVGLDAYEQQVAVIFGNGYGQDSRYVTANVNLWPRPLAIVLNDAAYSSMTDAQRDVLEKAASTALPATLGAARAEDETDVGQLCALDVTFPVASERQLAALHQAVQPVYDEITKDPANAGVLERITALKAQVGAPPDASVCPDQADSSVAFPEGSYEVELDNDALASCPKGMQQGSPGQKTWLSLEIRNGRVTMRERIDSPTAPLKVAETGTYSTVRDQVRIDKLQAHWSFDGTALRLTDLTGGSCRDTVLWTTHAWVFRSSPSSQTTGGLLDGTYETVLTAEDRHLCDGQPDGPALNPPGPTETWYLSLVLDHGDLRQFERHGSREAPAVSGYHASYRVFRDAFEFTDTSSGYVITTTFTFDGKTLTLTPVGPLPCGHRVVWTLHPWTLAK